MTDRGAAHAVGGAARAEGEVGAGRLVVVSGPSGVGKGTVVAEMRRQRPELALSTSATTRAQRPHEVHGQQYFFLTSAEFSDLIDADGFLEWAEFNGHRYGTPVNAVHQALAAGKTLLLEIEVQGARQVRQRMPNALLIFLAPPDRAELARRLEGRGTETSEEIAARLHIAEDELAAQADFDHVVVNANLDEAVTQILRILDA